MRDGGAAGVWAWRQVLCGARGAMGLLRRTKGVWYWYLVPHAPAAECGQWISYVSPTSMWEQCCQLYGVVNLGSCES